MALRCGVRHGWRRGVWLARASGNVLRIPAPSATTATRAVQGTVTHQPWPPRWRGAELADAVRLGVAEASAWVEGWRGQRPSGRLRCCPRQPLRPGRSGEALWKRRHPARRGRGDGTGSWVRARGHSRCHGRVLRRAPRRACPEPSGARALGDALVVLLNSDASVRRLKSAADPCRRSGTGPRCCSRSTRSTRSSSSTRTSRPRRSIGSGPTGQGRRLRRNRPPGSGPGPQLGRAGPAPAAPAGAVDNSDPQGCGVVLHDRNA